ncbi:MAG: hypothetical protein ABH857_01100 [Elusimicrobiota bacterium]
MKHLSKISNVLCAAQQNNGQAMVEYTLLIAVVAMAFMGASPLLDDAVKKLFISLADFIGRNMP